MWGNQSTLATWSECPVMLVVKLICSTVTLVFFGFALHMYSTYIHKTKLLDHNHLDNLVTHESRTQLRLPTYASNLLASVALQPCWMAIFVASLFCCHAMYLSSRSEGEERQHRIWSYPIWDWLSDWIDKRSRRDSRASAAFIFIERESVHEGNT